LAKALIGGLDGTDHWERRLSSQRFDAQGGVVCPIPPVVPELQNLEQTA